MNKMLSIGLSIIKKLCSTSGSSLEIYVNVRFLIVLLIREALVDDMWWQSAPVGGVKSAGGFPFSPFKVLMLNFKKSRLSKFSDLRQSLVDHRTCLAVLKSRSDAAEPGGGQNFREPVVMLLRFSF